MAMIQMFSSVLSIVMGLPTSRLLDFKQIFIFFTLTKLIFVNHLVLEVWYQNIMLLLAIHRLHFGLRLTPMALVMRVSKWLLS